MCKINNQAGHGVFNTVCSTVRTERGFSSIIGVNPFVIALIWLRYGVELLKEGVGILKYSL